MHPSREAAPPGEQPAAQHPQGAKRAGLDQRLRAAGKPPKLALVAAMRKLLLAVYVTARNLRPFVSSTEQARAA